MTKHCCQCKYCGELIDNFDLYSCNNEKSIYKACKLSATACNEFEEDTSENVYLVKTEVKE